MDRTEAMETWTEHVNSWTRFLGTLIADCEEKGDFGTKVKYSRQLSALTDISYGAVVNPLLVGAFVYPEGMTEAPLQELEFYNRKLNLPQQEAVKKALSAELLCLIQGPPGTGKTTVITEICLQILMHQPQSRILVCSETHIAVNNVMDKLYDMLDEFHALRIRNREIDPSDQIEQSTTDAYLQAYFAQLEEKGVRDDIRGMLREVFSNENPVKRRALEKQLIQSKRVVGITCNGMGAFPFGPDDEPFDYVVIDEVCKATLPEVLLPMSVAKKAILVGDPKQLPPLFCKEDTETMRELDALDIQDFKYIDSLFQRMPGSCYSMLRKQFRMTNEIGKLVSDCFYREEGGLENGLDRPSPGCIQWVDYPTDSRWPEEEGGRIVNLDEVEQVKLLLERENLALSGTAGTTPGAAGTTREAADATSEAAEENAGAAVENPDAAGRDTEAAEEGADSGSAKEKVSVAIISPYRPMVRTLRKTLERDGYDRLSIQIDTIDAFQGKDADIVIFCLTRNAGTLRFFSDPRRLNVAVSRAKDKLWIIGSKRYARRSRLLRDIMDRAC
ncbi:AAA domain-containing protein [Neobacillus sp. Marseille-QA0830]